MPRPAVRVSLGVRHLRDRRVRLTPLIRGPGGVRSGADERMPELDASAELTQPRRLGQAPRPPG